MRLFANIQKFALRVWYSQQVVAPTQLDRFSDNLVASTQYAPTENRSHQEVSSSQGEYPGKIISFTCENIF